MDMKKMCIRFISGRGPTSNTKRKFISNGQCGTHFIFIESILFSFSTYK